MNISDPLKPGPETAIDGGSRDAPPSASCHRCGSVGGVGDHQPRGGLHSLSLWWRRETRTCGATCHCWANLCCCSCTSSSTSVHRSKCRWWLEWLDDVTCSLFVRPIPNDPQWSIKVSPLKSLEHLETSLKNSSKFFKKKKFFLEYTTKTQWKKGNVENILVVRYQWRLRAVHWNSNLTKKKV